MTEPSLSPTGATHVRHTGDLPQEMVVAGRRYVTTHARDPEDAAMLLDMLGLTEKDAHD